MKYFVLKLTISVFVFACGLCVASVWNWSKSVENEQRKVSERPAATPTAAAIPELVPTPEPEIVFGRGRLRIVDEEVHLKSERLRYEIDVTYPQIVGSADRHIKNLNQRIKQLATKHYQWFLTPSKNDLRYYREFHPEVFNSLDFDYQVVLATDSLLSIYLNGYSYGIGAAHSVQYSFVVNYDLTARKELRLARLFKPGSKYLGFISRYCRNSLPIAAESGLEFLKDPQNWNITRDGIRFNFDACELSGCADGQQEVEIPFTDMKEILNTEMSLLKQLGV